ncbi:hypothetical protein [Actinomadura litoris]|uniref:Uncharacterized protein n=1 Tax=Actinomadura litoris TaxID=2678616 RepID=A0A7K1LB86_9ACTN|nr:hypothetical protein [Actinomadura litoris]MUN41682.1 hypothetical protein [Actinomadura litoris]
MNETQDYLGGEAGERVAAGLRALLTDASRGPVLVLGTLWPEHHAALTSRPGSQVRHLLDGVVIEVPETFADIDPAALRQAAGTDLRLAEAIEQAEDGHVTQYLAGGPELLDRLATADPAAKALMWAAMDARRLGHRTALPLPLLEQAAPAYLTDLQYDQLGEDWLEQALAYTSRPCKGARGALTRIRAAPSRRARGRRPGPAGEHAEVPVYRLADYLDQHARATRCSLIPPIGFWAAAAAHARPGDQEALGDAAWARGLYRDATQLHKNATTGGRPKAALTLVNHLHTLHPGDHRPADHVAAHASLRDLDAIDTLLSRLQEVGADEQVAVLAHRAAAHAPLDTPDAVASLLIRLKWAGADEQVAALADRAAAHVTLDAPTAVASLLSRLKWAGAEEQVGVLADRVAAHIALDNTYAVATLLKGLREVGADEQVTALLARDPATHITPDHPAAVAVLLNHLGPVGAEDQVAALLARDPAAHITLDDRYFVGALLTQLQVMGADEQVAALTDRLPAEGLFDEFLRVADHRVRYRFGREPDGRPAHEWGWDDLE